MKFSLDMFKPRKKYEKMNIIWVDRFGFITTKIVDVIERTKSDTTIRLQDGRQYKFSTVKIRKNTATVIERSDGKIKVLNPEDFRKIDLDNYSISEYRFNLQNIRIQESKSAMMRWIVPKTDMEKLLPLFKILFTSIGIGVVGWAVWKYGSIIFGQITSARFVDCTALIPNTMKQIVINGTTMLVP